MRCLVYLSGHLQTQSFKLTDSRWTYPKSSSLQGRLMIYELWPVTAPQIYATHPPTVNSNSAPKHPAEICRVRRAFVNKLRSLLAAMISAPIVNRLCRVHCKGARYGVT